MLNERFIQLGEVALNVVDGPPSGTPLLLIHGGGNRWQEFLPIIPGLAMRWHIYALDLRGHGKSGWVAGQYRPEHYAADVLALIEALALDRVILFGHSLGGWIALEAAARLGKKVHALILGDPPLNIERFVVDESREARIDMWRGLRDLVSMELNVDELASALAEIPVSVSEAGEPVRYGDLPGVNSVQIRRWAKDLHQLDPDVAAYHAGGRIREYVKHIDIDNSLRTLDCPVLLIQGDPSQGGVASDEDVKNALALLDEGLHIQLEHMGHDLGMESWDVSQLLMAMTSFLESL